MLHLKDVEPSKAVEVREHAEDMRKRSVPRIVGEFIDGNEFVKEVVEDDGVFFHMERTYNAIQHYLKRNDLRWMVKVSMKDGRLFLIRAEQKEVAKNAEAFR